MLEKIDLFLDHPSVDPHGDPIPSAAGELRNGTRVSSLAECPAGQPVRVARVIDQGPAFLQFVHRCGLLPGVSLTVELRDPVADAVRVRPLGREALTLGTAAAAKILVEEANSAPHASELQ